jgi:hypothetical protein
VRVDTAVAEISAFAAVIGVVLAWRQVRIARREAANERARADRELATEQARIHERDLRLARDFESRLAPFIDSCEKLQTFLNLYRRRMWISRALRTELAQLRDKHVLRTNELEQAFARAMDSIVDSKIRDAIADVYRNCTAVNDGLSAWTASYFDQLDFETQTVSPPDDIARMVGAVLFRKPDPELEIAYSRAVVTMAESWKTLNVVTKNPAR